MSSSALEDQDPQRGNRPARTGEETAAGSFFRRILRIDLLRLPILSPDPPEELDVSWFSLPKGFSVVMTELMRMWFLSVFMLNSLNAPNLSEEILYVL